MQKHMQIEPPITVPYKRFVELMQGSLMPWSCLRKFIL